MGPVLLLRVLLPDRPGSLGAVATALGQVGADISAFEIVERAEDHAINDFMLTVPTESLPDTLITACTAVPGVRVLWLSRYPEHWGLSSDIDALEAMTAQPEHALATLADEAPSVFHSQWALVLDDQRALVAASTMAPPVTPADLATFGRLDELHTADLPEGWLPAWGQTTVAITPAARGHALVVGRTGGPAFLRSELRRLHHLASLA